MLSRKVKSAMRYWKSGGPGYVAGITADRLVRQLRPVLPPLTYKSLRMRFLLGYWPSIRNPRSLNEKVAHRQLFAPHRLSPLVADKWRVRQYIAERGLSHILNEVYCVTNEPEKIPFDDLPEQFAIRANHGCGWNIFVTDKRALDRQKVVRQCREWLSLKYGRASRDYETHYDSIPPLILVERYLHDERYGVPLDYKIDCFHGRALYIGVRRSGPSAPAYSRYDPSWNQLSFAKSRTYSTCVQFPRPAKLKTMLDVAERLSSGFDYCRVDLYLLNDEELLFGEITMNPDGGRNPILKEWDFRLGELW